MTPAERRLRAQIAAEVSWANTEDRARRTSAAREAANARFERQARELHPEGSVELIAKVAAALSKAHIARMTRNSLRARAAKTSSK